MTLVEIFATLAPNKYIFVAGFGFLIIGVLTWLVAVHWGGIDGASKIGSDSDDEDDVSESDVDTEYEAQKEKTRKEKEAFDNEKSILDMEKAFLTELEEMGRIRKQEEKQENEYRQEEEKRQQEYDKKQKAKPDTGFDWHNRQNAANATNTNVRNKNSRQNVNATLKDSTANKKQLQTDEPQKQAVMLGVLVNLIEEKFSDNEIARAIVFQNGKVIPGEDLLHTIEAVRSFVDAGETVKSDNGRQRTKFGLEPVIGGTRVIHKAEIPVNDNRERFVEQDLKAKEKSLKNLLNGDVNSAVNILEKEIKRQEKTGKAMKNGPKRKSLYKVAAELACHAGTLAVMVNPNKAIESFKLAMFLNPESADGHSRYGDLCFNLGLNEKAEKAFMNVRKLADKEKGKRLIANANNKLGKILATRGEKEKAEKRRRESTKLFKELGFTAELSKQEQKAAAVLKETMQKQLMNAN